MYQSEADLIIGAEKSGTSCNKFHLGKRGCRLNFFRLNQLPAREILCLSDKPVKLSYFSNLIIKFNISYDLKDKIQLKSYKKETLRRKRRVCNI